MAMETNYPIEQEFHDEPAGIAIEENGSYLLHGEDNLLLRVEVYNENIIRFRYATDGYFEGDFSYAISKKFQKQAVKTTLADAGTHFELSSPKLVCHISKNALQVAIFDKKGHLICEDERGFHWEPHPQYGGDFVKMSKKVQLGEHFYGLGDKPTHLNLRGKRLAVWSQDEYGFMKHRDPIYKSIPFYIGLHHHLAYGIFYDNTFRSFFDFASERKNVCSYWAEGGEMNYYFIYGPEMVSVTQRYTELTGVPELPPLWALGYHQCKWSYYPESMVRSVCERFRELEIPCDAIYLDIDYMNGFRCFTWDKEKFPNPKRMVADLKQQGFKTIVIIDPGIKVDKDYWVFREAIEKGYFCRRADGPYMKGKVWPGECYFPDFTRPEVRDWWASLYQELIEDIGVKGVWNDMNEPALFEVPSKTFPDDVRHDFDGHPCSHRKAHNVYGMQMSRATYMGVKRFAYPNRPFIITRSTYSGGQRYSSGWTGDNIATWDHVGVANVQCQRMAISGFSFVGSDIGGFTEHPTSELYTRWIQMGVFHPFCRTHSSGDHGEQEPWSFGEETTAIVKKYIELRYKLLPYIYTTFWQYVNQYKPMLRPLCFVDQNDQHTLYREDEFMLGDSILIVPVMEPNVEKRPLYLPKGRWYNFWTDELVEGGHEFVADAPLEQQPVFIKYGAILPLWPVMQYVGEKQVDELTLHVYYKHGEETSLLYEDKGDGYEYESGECNVKTFHWKGNKKSAKLSQETVGRFTPSYESYHLVLHGLPFPIGSIQIDGQAFSMRQVEALSNGQWAMTVPTTFEEILFEK
jgi:alpha-glucosidase